LTFVFK